jgi:hypothetical protein
MNTSLLFRITDLRFQNQASNAAVLSAFPQHISASKNYSHFAQTAHNLNPHPISFSLQQRYFRSLRLKASYFYANVFYFLYCKRIAVPELVSSFNKPYKFYDA